MRWDEQRRNLVVIVVTTAANFFLVVVVSLEWKFKLCRGCVIISLSFVFDVVFFCSQKWISAKVTVSPWN